MAFVGAVVHVHGRRAEGHTSAAATGPARGRDAARLGGSGGGSDDGRRGRSAGARAGRIPLAKAQAALSPAPPRRGATPPATVPVGPGAGPDAPPQERLTRRDP